MGTVEDVVRNGLAYIVLGEPSIIPTILSFE